MNGIGGASRREKTIGWMLLGACLLLAGLPFVHASTTLDTVLVVSIDALHPSALDEKNAPALHALHQKGVATLNGRSVDPPKTLIAHTAMLTGLPPAQNGKQDNEWTAGEPRVTVPTLFDDAKALGFRTAYYYAKPKLGYLVSDAIDEQALVPDGAIPQATAFLNQPGQRFVFLHISGLEYAGTHSGWLSADYRDELSYIDMLLEPLIALVEQRGHYLIVVTSDHAGHDNLHGTQHPEDYKLPLLLAGNANHLPQLPEDDWPLIDLRRLVSALIGKNQ